MSTVIAKNVQVGTSGTPAQNFTVYQPASPDGTVRVGNGNSGSVTDLLTLNSSGNLSLVGSAAIQGLTVGRGAGAVSTNTAVGANALQANTSGGRNTALGNETLFSNTTGNNNLAVGGRDDGSWTPLYSNTTGSNNTAVGNAALSRNTTASHNVAVGYRAGYVSNTDYNTFVGSYTGQANTTGARNTFIGSGAGSQNTTGSFNTFIGAGNDSSGQLVTTGSKNTIIGAYNGNQGGVDIRTSSNYIVLSDGDGDPAFIIVPAAINGGINGRWFSASQSLGTTNLNTIFKCGMYRVDINAPNTPTNNFYAVNVYGNGNNVTTQLATVIAGSATYVRSFNTSWSAWVQL